MQFRPNGQTKLMLSEYGRNVQKMVRFLKTIEDRDLRNRQAEVVVGIMANLYPYKRDTDGFRHMLWDHLFMIADFDIDIDSPYPRPTPSLFSPVAQRIPYTQKRIAQKHYGGYARRILLEVMDSDASEQDKEIVVSNIARYMRQSAYNYNNEYPSNDVVLSDIKNMTGGNLEISALSLSSTNVITSKDNNNRQRNGQQTSSSGPRQQQRTNKNNYKAQKGSYQSAAGGSRNNSNNNKKK